MLNFTFTENSLQSTNGYTTAVVHGGVNYLSNHQGKDGVLRITGGALAFHESALNYSSDAFVVKLSFMLDEKSGSSRFLWGTTIPLELRLFPKGQNEYRLQAWVMVNGNKRRIESEDVILGGQWYDLKLLLLDGELLCFINDEPFLRRVFKGEAKRLSEVEDSKFFLGSDGEAFFGYIDSISFSEDITGETEIVSELSNRGYFETESKYDDLILSGMDLGALQSKNHLLHSNFNCRYDQFEKGVIFWSFAYKAVWMSKEIFEKYLDVLKEKPIGLPVEDEANLLHEKGRYCLFERGGLFFIQKTNKVYYVKGVIMNVYGETDLADSEWGIPEDEENSSRIGSDFVSWIRFTHCTVFALYPQSKAEFVLVVQNPLADAYIQGMKKYGIMDELVEGFVEGYNEKLFPSSFKRKTNVYYLVCEKTVLCMITRSYVRDSTKKSTDTIYEIPRDFYDFFVEKKGTNEADNYGKYLYPLGNTVKTPEGIVYQDFKGGVLLRYPDEDRVYGFTDLKIVLGDIESGRIYDPPNKSAELYITVFLEKDGIPLVDGKRWPDYSARKHGGQAFSIVYLGNEVDADHPAGSNVYYDLPEIKGTSRIKLHIKVYDYDYSTRNDYLGSYTFDLGIETGWGTIKDCLDPTQRMSVHLSASGDRAVYEKVYLMHQGSDNRGGYENIKLSFRIESERDQVNVDEDFRRYGYWSINNYSTQENLSRSLFNTTFSTQTGQWYDWIFRFLDNLWFYWARASFSGKEGYCFGLSLEALYALRGKSPYDVPLSDWDLYAEKTGSNRFIRDRSEVDPGFAERISAKHLFQGGWAHVKMIMNKLIEGEFFIPSLGIAEIKNIIDRDTYCLVNLYGGGGHSVLAYKYDGDKVYVADSNCPWWYAGNNNTSEGDGRDSSYIQISTDFFPKAQLISVKGKKEYSFVYGTPYSVLSKYPRVPSWWDIAGAVFDTAVSVTEFVFMNLREYIMLIAVGDCDIESASSGENKINIARIPSMNRFAIEEQEDSGIGFRMAYGFVENTFNARLKGTAEGKYTCVLITRSRVFYVENEISLGQLETITVSSIGKSDAGVTVSSQRPHSVVLSWESIVKKYGRDKGREPLLRPSDPSAREEEYYVNSRRQKTGEHEMHRQGCPGLPQEKNRVHLGRFTDEFQALEAARAIYQRVDGCSICCKATNTDPERDKLDEENKTSVK